MPDEKIKRRLARAKTRAAEILQQTGYNTIVSDNNIFCVVGSRRKEVRFIRVVIDNITARDIETVKDFRTSGTKEIWCKQPNDSSFKIEEVSEL